MYTEKDLVNHILLTLGQDSTPTLETNHPAVIDARTWLMSVNKEFQGKGWWFNRSWNLKLLPNTEGRVAVPEDTLSFTVTQCALGMSHAGRRYVKKGKYIWDSVLHTDVLKTAVWADLVTLWDYDDLPPSAGTFLKHFSAEQAFLNDDGDIQVHSRLLQRAGQAFADLKKDEMRSAKPNAIASPFGIGLIAGRPRSQMNRTNPVSIGG